MASAFVSPSLGATFRVNGDSLLRASAARGFTAAPLTASSAGGLFLDPNPSLKPERVWSYQAGLESSALKVLWAKITLFRHDVDDALEWVSGGGGAPLFNDLYVNAGSVRRQGIEAEAETVPFYHLSLRAGFAYVDLDPANVGGSTQMRTWDVGLRYDDKESVKALLSGR